MSEYCSIRLLYIRHMKKNKLKLENIMKLSINMRQIKKTSDILKLANNQ